MAVETEKRFDGVPSPVSPSMRKPWVRPQIEDANALIDTTAFSTDRSNVELGTAKNGS